MGIKISEWKRNCPKCNKDLYYKSRSSYCNAKASNAGCYSCRSGQSHPHSEAWKLHLSQIQTVNGIPYVYRKFGKTKKDFWEKRICLQCNFEFEVLKSSKKKFCTFVCAMKHLHSFNGVKISKPELMLSKILVELSIQYESQFELHGKLYDFHIKNTNILIEVDGIYWHGREKEYKYLTEVQRKNRENDSKKEKIAKENGYTIIRMWEDEITKENIMRLLNVPKYIL